MLGAPPAAQNAESLVCLFRITKSGSAISEWSEGVCCHDNPNISDHKCTPSYQIDNGIELGPIIRFILHLRRSWEILPEVS